MLDQQATLDEKLKRCFNCVMADKTSIELAIAAVGTATGLAEALDVSVQAVGQWKAGARPIPPERCVEIERLTNGTVSADSLSPDSRWIRVHDPSWPHPGGRPLLDVAAPREPQPTPSEQGSA